MNPIELFLSILIKEARKHVLPTGDLPWSVDTWIREHRTIRLGLPRQSGKTSAVIEVAGKTPSLVIAPNKPMTNQFLREGLPEIRVSSVGDIHPQLLVEDDIELMLVDEAFMVTPEQTRAIYEFAERLWARGRLNEQKFVLVFIGT